MRQRNRLYTVNKFNKPLFIPEENLFPTGGPMLVQMTGLSANGNGMWNTNDTNVFFGMNTGLSGNAMQGLQAYNQQLAAQNQAQYLRNQGNYEMDNPFSLKESFGKGAVKAGLKAGAGAAISAGAGLVGGLAGNAISGGLSSGAGNAISSIGSTVGSAVGSVNPVLGAAVNVGSQILGGVTNALFGTKVDQAKLNNINQNVAKLSSFESNAGTFDDIRGPEAVSTDTDAYSGGLFSSGKAKRKNRELKEKLVAARDWANRSVDNNVFNLVDDQNNDALANFAAYGGPIDFGGGALGLMQQNRYFDTIDKRSEAIAGKGQTMQTGFTGGAKTFADGGLKAAFLDNFGSDPIGAAVRYNQGLEALAAQEEANQIEAEREAEYLAMQKRLADLETTQQGLQALVAAQPTSSLSVIPEIEETPASSSSPSRAAYNSNWDYIEDQLKRSGKFNDVQIKGIKYNLQRESSLDPTVVGDGGAAFGLGQWHGSRKPKDMSLEGQTKHLIDTISNFDGKEHWIRKSDYEGFLNARTPEEAHYYLAKGYERPRADIVAKVKRDSDMSLSKLKAFGGELGTNGTDFTNGLLYIDEGGSHESSPLDGVPMGLDPEGIPNLVEEGETVYNDYVFSDRMNVPDFMLKDLGLPKSKKGISFADASKKLAQESEKRPNDPISKDGLQASLSRLAEIQETERMKQQAEEYMGLGMYACGGKMGRKYAGPGNKSNKLKPYKFDPIENFKYWDKEADDYDEGYRDFIENQLNEDWINRVMAGNYGDMSRYKKANNFNPTVEQTWQLGLDRKNSDWHRAMAAAYDEYKAGIDPKTGKATEPVIPLTDVPDETWELDPYSEGWEERRSSSTTPDYSKGTKEQEGLGNPKTYATWMRYAPAVGSGIMTLTDALGLTNKPDYTYADRIAGYAERAGVAPQISYKPIGNYLTYRPMDIWFEQNRMDANARATDRAILNNAAPVGTKMAGLLASGYNNQIANGQLYRNALEYNDAKRERVADFNRKTNMFNSQMGLEAAMANARYTQAARQMGLSGLAQAAALRDSIDARVGASRSANLSNFLTSLGNIGRENFALNQINTDRSRHYTTDSRGRSNYKRKKKSDNE